MAIAVAASQAHWNYLLALERDLELVARYVEFAEQNFSTYSIELAHLLFAASSEVDVVAKLLCEIVDPAAKRENINDYKLVLRQYVPGLVEAQIFVPRYGLQFQPFVNWRGNQNPHWWKAYNKVKHERATHFSQATLKNALNAIGALLAITFEYYSRKLTPFPQVPVEPREVMSKLQPQTSMLRLNSDYYYEPIYVA